jgi:hypothetical protein
MEGGTRWTLPLPPLIRAGLSITWKLSNDLWGSLSSNCFITSQGPSPTPTSTMDRGRELAATKAWMVSASCAEQVFGGRSLLRVTCSPQPEKQQPLCTASTREAAATTSRQQCPCLCIMCIAVLTINVGRWCRHEARCEGMKALLPECMLLHYSSINCSVPCCPLNNATEAGLAIRLDLMD